MSKDFGAFKRTYCATESLKKSAIAAGYTEGMAAQGIARMPKQIKTFVLAKQRKLNKLALLGATLSAEQQEATVRGALLSNVAAGKDHAVNSLKLLGQDKRVSMFTPDSALGVIVIQAPPALPQSCPVIDESGQVIE